MSGFACTGIYPFNRNTFDETNFLPSNVTDRRLQEADLPGTTTSIHSATEAAPSANVPVTSGSTEASSTEEQGSLQLSVMNKAKEYRRSPIMMSRLHLSCSGRFPRQVRGRLQTRVGVKTSIRSSNKYTSQVSPGE